MKPSVRVLVVLAPLALLPTHLAANPVVIVAETCFEANLEGWELVLGPQEQLTWEPSGDESGGFARFEDASTMSDLARAPSDYLGDWSWMDGVGYLRWDQRVFRLGHDPSIGDYRAVIAGPGGRAVFTLPGPAGVTDWVPIVAHIYEGVWDIETGSWPGILAQVDSVLIDIEIVDNQGAGPEADVCGLDNVVLGAPYADLPPGSVQPTSWGAIKALWSGL
jgi:hypothetical protein